MPEATTVTRELLCTLTDVELRERGDQMAAAELRAETLKAERRRLNASIREQTDQRTVLAAAIDARKELREVTCEWVQNRKRKCWELRRMDSKELLPEEREMTPEDLQERLPDVELPAATPPKTKKKGPRPRLKAAKKRAA